MNHTRTHKTVRSLLVWLLLLTMVFGLLPMAAFADEAGEPALEVTEPTPEPETTPEPEQPEPTQEPETTPEPEQPGDADVTIEGDEEQPEDEDNDEVILDDYWLYPQPMGISERASTGDFMKIFFLDCGRKYFSVDNIKKLIDNASAAGFNYIQLAVGNDGLRFLLDDMSLTVNGTLYTTEQVSAAIHAGNNSYHYFDVDALTESQMNDIIAYATKKSMGVIPCVNTPGHMDAILSAATALTGKTCSYSGSVRTIDVTNATAVAFTQALLQKYIDYFAGKDCRFFNMGADEYANDIYTGGSMGFGNLQDAGKYSNYVQYVNQVARKIKDAGMTPMAFNDGIYFANNTWSGQFDTGILICYWSSGWSGYSPMSASSLKSKGFSLVNTNGDYYWVLGKPDWQCSPEKASGFNINNFQGGTISDPSGAMFCIWCDYPGDNTDVISKTAKTIAAFGKALPNPPTPGGGETGDGVINLTVGQTSSEIATTAGVGEQTTGDSYIATASVTKGTATEKTLKEITTESELSADKQYLIVNIRKNAVLTATTSQYNAGTYIRPKYYNVLSLNGQATTSNKNIWKIEPSGTGYTVKYSSNNTYLNIGENTAFLNSTPVALTIEYKNNVDNKGWYISYNGAYLNALGNKDGAGGWNGYGADNDIGSTWKIYEIVEPSSSNVLTFTGTGEGETTANIGGVEYTIKVTARETSETKTLNFGESFALPADAEEVTIDGSAVTHNGGSIVAGDTAGNATVTAVVKNTGGKVTDRYTYTVIVTNEAPDGSMTGNTLTLEYWITNNMVYDGESTSTNHTKSITSTEAAGADGIEIKTIAPDQAYGFFDGTVTVYYWQAMRLDSEHKQTDGSGVDQTAAGTTLTHVRYNANGAWQYKTADGAWHYFQSDDQLVAYYLQKTDVTKEITTFTKDWGYGTGSTTPDTSSNKGQVALSVAVVYPDGQLSPTEDKIYSQSTTIFNFWDNRDIGIVAPVNNSDYNISKITVTDGTRTSNTTANQWYASDTITWEKVTTASGGQWYKETVVWDKSSGTTPMVNGAASNIRWSEKNTAKLILIYLEPVEKDTNLEIVYYDDTASREIKSYQVSMTYNQGDPEPTFETALKQDDTVIGGRKDWPGTTALEPNYLPDDAYVLNSANFKETFNKNLTELTGITDNYKSGIYEYNGAKISEDGKTLTLHYQVKAFENSKTIVVDFGLPVEVTGLLDWFGVDNVSTVKNISLAKATELYDSVGSYGHAVINQVTWNSLTYTLQELIDAEITIPLYLNYKSGDTQLHGQLKVIPATNVYYEDSFVGEGFKNGTGTAASAVWELDGTEKTAKQALSVLGSKDIYGNDEAYNNSSKFSMGSAKTVTVNSGMLNGWNETSAWPTATFTFKGTGFDIISLTNNKSGSIFVDVYAGAKAEGNRIKSYIVNNYYGYTYENGKWVVKQGEGDTLYQIPVMKIRDLDYGEYTAVVTVFYDGAFNSTGTEKCSFWFDGFRVYDPMGKDNSIYTQDEEGYPQYIKLRDVVINKNEAKALFIDGAAEANVAEYKNYGPNNEVYLAATQAISFKLPANGDITSIQIGAKSPNASDTVKPTMSVKINDTTLDPKEIGTATEMYYKISASGADAQQVTITNTGKAILSLTNIKITYSEKSTTELAALSEGDEQAAVAAVRALYAAPVVEPVEPFKPGRFETSWSSNVRKGSRAVLTVKASTDVDAIVVNGVTVTQFKTRTERIGYGWNAKRVTYREFSYMMTANEVGTINIPVVAVSNDLGSSAAYDSTLTVKPSSPIRDWIGGIFGRWF